MTNKRKLIIAAIALVAITAIVLLICLIPKERELTELERVTLKDQSSTIMRYMEEIDVTTDGAEALPEKLSDIGYDRYIAYALEYSHGEEGKDNLSAEDIKKIIESKFDVELDIEKIKTTGLTPILLNKNVNHDISQGSYSIQKDGFSKRDIAAIPIDVYLEKETKVDGKNYAISYEKYTIKNPYDAVPYAADDASGINDYLNGKGKVTAIKQILNADNADKIATHKKSTTVKFSMKNDKILVIFIK